MTNVFHLYVASFESQDSTVSAERADRLLLRPTDIILTWSASPFAVILINRIVENSKFLRGKTG